MKRLLPAGFGCALILLAQERPDATPAPLIYPSPIVQPGRALREYLNLTEAQGNSLQEVQKSRSDAERAIYEQIRQKQTALNALLSGGSNDHAQIGRLMTEVRDLQNKLPLSGEPYRTRALSVLTQDQRNKLAPLTAALQVQGAANDAVFWNLIDRPKPAVDGPIILRLPVPEP